MSGVPIDHALAQALEHHRAGRLAEAEAIYRQILAAAPQHADALHLLGEIAFQTGHLDSAADLIRQAIAISPDSWSYHSNLGSVLHNQGQLAPAIEALTRAIQLNPNHPPDHFHLGNVLFQHGDYARAVDAYREMLKRQPDHDVTYYNLGVALLELARFDEAIAAFQGALKLNPNMVTAHSNLGNALKETGQLDLAIESYRQALRINPNHTLAHSNLVFAMSYHPAYDAAAVVDEARRWERQHAQPLAHLIKPHTNHRDPNHRLRIGYVSRDFDSHPVGRFMFPLLTMHDRQQFEIFAYHNGHKADAVTEMLASRCDHWRNIVNVTDDDAAELIRQDGIDILVDLAMHTAGNRLLVFARKPAPVQVTYLAYTGTTGMAAIDCRLTDPYLDPPESKEDCYVEKSIRLPETYWCYPPTFPEIPIGPLPALRNGYVTFGSLNGFSKVLPSAITTWAKLLQQVPSSRLLMLAPEGDARRRVTQQLADESIDALRVEFIGRLEFNDYFKTYDRIDVALDAFPYSGGTTTCDALWRGVPVVTLRGQPATARGATSVLSSVGLPELIAQSPEQYVQIAAGLANDIPRLTELRSTLRSRMQRSPLMDVPRFARNVEAAYRQMWRTRCGR